MTSCYAPTNAASREEKDKFFDTLQQAISAIPPREELMIMGDFNAHIGSKMDEREWWYIRGPHGFGELNDAGSSC